MTYLCLRTDTPVAQLSLYSSSGVQLATTSWEAGRSLAKELLGVIETFLHDNDHSWESLDGLVVYKGPGSFTGLRISITVANTIAYVQHLPIIGETDETWNEIGVRRLIAGENDQIVLPLYGAEPRITIARK